MPALEGVGGSVGVVAGDDLVIRAMAAERVDDWRFESVRRTERVTVVQRSLTAAT